jgi:hypothetical protein
MSKPTANDTPQRLAEWLQFNDDEAIQGIHVVNGVVDLRDVRGHQQVMARAGPRQRGKYAHTYLTGLFRIASLLAVPGLYEDIVQAMQIQIAPEPDMSACSFATPNSTDADVAQLLAQKGLAIATANDAWQYCFKFLEEEVMKPTPSIDRDEALAALQRAREQLGVHSRPLGLSPLANDLYSKPTYVPNKTLRR